LKWQLNHKSVMFFSQNMVLNGMRTLRCLTEQLPSSQQNREHRLRQHKRYLWRKYHFCKNVACDSPFLICGLL
jgi:hypothetical protein